MDKDISATEFAYFNTYSDDDFGEKYIETLDCVTVFRDEIKKNISAVGFTGDMENITDIIHFVCKCCARTFPNDFNDPNDKSRTVKFNRNTISRWLGSDDVPVSNIASREIMYKLCFALQMDEHAARDFFYKGCLERPFNYKNIREAIYFFCFKYHKSYENAMSILEKIEAAPKTDNPDADSCTSVIANKIQAMCTETELIEYLIENRTGFTLHNNSAYKLIENELLPTCMELAAKELARIAEQNAGGPGAVKAEKVDNIDKLLSVIYGYDARATLEKKKLFKHSISDKAASKFPRLIKENFPQREQFKNIAKHEASTGVVRKALIILKFYEFFTQAYLSNPLSLEFDLWEEFVDEINATLEMCGYVQLYWRNPFDWLIGHCAQEASEGGKPVDRLRNLIDTFYLSEQP